MALIPGPDFETGNVGASETIDLTAFLVGSGVIIQSAFYGLDATGTPIAATVDPTGKHVTVTVLAGIHGVDCMLVSPSLNTETVALGQSGTAFALPTVIGGAGTGVVIIKGV